MDFLWNDGHIMHCKGKDSGIEGVSSVVDQNYTRKCWENAGSDLGLCWVWPGFNLDLLFSYF